MSSPPLIGLSGRRKTGAQIDGFPADLATLDIDVYIAAYSRGIIEAGGVPVHLPLDVDIEKVVERLDGVVLTGGADIDPSRFGADPHPELIDPEPIRDEQELSLFGRALELDLPVLGICRGLQLINVHQGGTLTQHVPAHSRYETAFTHAHPVSFAEGSLVHRLYGDTIDVNTLHHQVVDELGDGLVVTARSDDGEVEAVEMGDKVVAVQWHPEMMTTRPTDPIFTWIVDRSKEVVR